MGHPEEGKGAVPQPADARGVLTLALGDVRREWRALLVIDLAFKVLAAVFLVPLATAGARLLIATSGQDAVADQAIISFLLSPAGLVTLLAVGTAEIGFFALELTALLAGASRAARGRRVVPREALGFTLRHAPVVLSLAGRIWMRTLLIVLPFLGACGAVYMALLTRFDINYYLKERPPTFVLAVVLAAILLIVMLWLLVPRLIGWSLALPIVLFEGVAPSQAMALSSDRVRAHGRTVRRTLAAWAACGVIVSMIAFGTVRAVSHVAIAPVVDRLRWLLPALAVVLLLWVAAYLLANVVIMVGLGTVGTRLHERTGGETSAGTGWADQGTEAAPGGWRLSRRALVGLLAGSFIVAVGFGWALLGSIRLDTSAEIIAHRGASAAAPENTMAAFQAAIDQATDWVELDVQETSDGAVVVMHDADLMRLARSPLKIWASTEEQISGVDIGSWLSPQFAGERVPTLERVLLRCKDHAKVVIELKYYGHDQRLEERVAEIVERTGMQDQISVMSLRYEMVLRMKSLRPGWTVGLLTAKSVGKLTAMQGDFLAVSTGMATAARVDAAHAAGKKLYVWTVDDPMTMALMVTRGADGLITNEPAVARRLLRRMDEATTGERLLLGLATWFGIEPRATDITRDVN